MARKGWFELAADAPWPVGFVLGLVGWIGIAWVLPPVMASLDNPFLSGLGRKFAEMHSGFIGEGVLLLFWSASLVAFLNRRKRKKLNSNVASGAPGFSALAAESEPACPKCASPMVMRTARASGERFWGCTTFPKCRGTLAAARS